MKANPTRHFRQRVVERMEGVDPLMLARGVVWAIDNARTDIAFAGSGRLKL